MVTITSIRGVYGGGMYYYNSHLWWVISYNIPVVFGGEYTIMTAVFYVTRCTLIPNIRFVGSLCILQANCLI